MGAALVYRTFPDVDQSRIRELVLNEIEENRIQHGCTGTWTGKSGVNIVSRIKAVFWLGWWAADVSNRYKMHSPTSNRPCRFFS